MLVDAKSETKADSESSSKQNVYTESGSQLTSRPKDPIDKCELIQKCFASIVDNCLSRRQMWVLSQVDDPKNKKVKSLKRCATVSKFHKEDFMSQNGLSEIDAVLSRINCTNRQIKLYNEFFR